MTILPLPDLEAVLLRWAEARMSAHEIIIGDKEPDPETFLHVFRSSEDVPLLVARVRQLEKAA